MLFNISKMKKSILIIAFFVCSIQVSLFSQTNTNIVPPSEAEHGYTYDFDKVNNLIFERLTNPTIINEIARVIVEEKSFPKLTVGEEIDSIYKKKVGKWIEANQNLIIETFKNRSDIVQSY